MAGTGFNETRAELFEALGHPMRIKILEALESKPMGFADLKKQVGIESSGHLQFHLRKLGSLVQGEDSGDYSLSDEGREALRVFRTTAHTGSRSDGRRVRLPRASKKTATIAAAVILLFVLWVSVVSGATLYNTQESLTTSYTKPLPGNPLNIADSWVGASFNDSHGAELAYFGFFFYTTNQSQGPVSMRVSFGPNFVGGFVAPVYIDSLAITFSSEGNFWPDVGASASLSTGSLEPTSISRISGGSVVVNYHNLGTYGQGTITRDLWFQLLGVASLTPTNHTVTLTVDLVAHRPHPLIVGQSFSAEAIFHLIVESSGLVLLSDNSS